jgi:hypothetical protein
MEREDVEKAGGWEMEGQILWMSTGRSNGSLKKSIPFKYGVRISRICVESIAFISHAQTEVCATRLLQ